MRAPLPLLALTALLGCGPTPVEPLPTAPRLVVLYATCTLNEEHLGPYAGGAIDYTPTFDRLAREGTLFRRHESESGQSGISFASLFSGTQADRHGVFHHPQELPGELWLVTEAFADAGYEPWFWSGHSMAASELAYGQGVDPKRVVRFTGRARKLAVLQPGEAPFEALLAKLAADPDYRAFVLVSFTVTHGAYHRQLPEAAYAQFLTQQPEHAAGLTLEDLRWAWALYDEHRLALQWDYPAVVESLGLTPAQEQRLARALEATYRADVAGLDALLGRTMETLAARGLAQDTLLAFTADHGETLFREGTLFHWTHGFQLAPEVIGVPWILHWPALQDVDGRVPHPVYEGVTRSIDVYPTLAGLCGIPLDGRGVAGTDLSGVLLGREPEPHQLAFSHTSTLGPLAVEEFRGYGLAGRYFGSTDPELMWVRVRDGDRVWKLVGEGDGSFALRGYDLAADPRELVELGPAPERSRMEALLRDYKERLVTAFHERGTRGGPLDAAQRLRELGYIGEEEPGD